MELALGISRCCRQKDRKHWVPYQETVYRLVLCILDCGCWIMAASLSWYKGSSPEILGLGSENMVHAENEAQELKISRVSSSRPWTTAGTSAKHPSAKSVKAFSGEAAVLVRGRPATDELGQREGASCAPLFGEGVGMRGTLSSN